MGVACILSCRQCSYNKNVFLGIGFRYISLQAILEWYEEEEGRKQIIEYINKKEPIYECYDGLYLCQNCNYILNKTYLHLEAGSQSYTNSYSCPRCRDKMPSKPLENETEINRLNCPECKCSNLKVEFYMDWD